MDKDLFGNPVVIGGQKMWTSSELAAEAQVSRARIRQLAIEGRFPGAVKFGRDWAIPDDSARVWMSADRDRRYKSKD